MNDEIPTIQLVQLYGREFSVALSQAISRLIRGREWLDVATLPLHQIAAKTQIRISAQIITDIAAALRKEIARIDSEWFIYDDLEDVRSYRQFLTHLLDRGLVDEKARKETECQNPE